MELPNKPNHMFTALDIATRSEDLDCWSVGADNAPVIATAREEHYSFLPVRQDGDIVGVGRTDELATGFEWVPLTSDWLIASNTPIIDLVSLFAERPEQVFFVLHGKEVGGLVAPADLNKIPARAAIYLLIAELESHLANLIRYEMPQEEDYLVFLANGRINALKNRQAQAASNDLELDLLHHMDFFDLTTIARKHPRLSILLDSPSDREMRKVNKVRNAVSHQVGVLLSSRKELNELHEVCQRVIYFNRLAGDYLNTEER